MNKLKSIILLLFGVACLISVYILRVSPESVREEYRSYNTIILIIVVLYIIYNVYMKIKKN